MAQTVLVTGVFDLLHPGHINLLAEIRVRYPYHLLTVGINGDRRAAEIKELVFFSAEERKMLLEAIQYVDRVVIFEEDTPEHLIRCLRPSVFVKGSDWSDKDLPEAGACIDVGAMIVFIPAEIDPVSKQKWSSSGLKGKLNVGP